MATLPDYIEFVCDQIAGTAGDIRYKKMFGEYMVYVNDKPLLLVCDNTVFVKKLPGIQEKMAHADSGFPYDGAKEHWILDIEDGEFAKEVVTLLEDLVPVPKKKKPAKS